MIRLAGAQSVAERIGKSDFVIVDPRRPMKYLSGHLSGAVNLPVYRAFGDNGSLLDPAALAEWLGANGIGEGVPPVLYDSPQGQNAAMLAWIMEYLGAPEIFLLDVFFERWKSDGREVVYRPVQPAARRFVPRLNERLRATLDEVHRGIGHGDVRLRTGLARSCSKRTRDQHHGRDRDWIDRLRHCDNYHAVLQKS